MAEEYNVIVFTFFTSHGNLSRAGLVDIALRTGKLFSGAGFKYISESFKTGTLHLIGLLSDGGVHARLDQLLVLFLCHKQAKTLPHSRYL